MYIKIDSFFPIEYKNSGGKKRKENVYLLFNTKIDYFVLHKAVYFIGCSVYSV